MSPNTAILLIVLLPAAGAVINGLLPLMWPSLKRREGLIGTIGTAVVAIPFVVALMLFLDGFSDPHVASFYTWMGAGDFNVSVAYRLDHLSLIMTLVVTGVGALIHLYSVGYMHGDRSYWKFFAYLNLFIFMMLNLVLADNLLVLFLGWEGVGLCSYLLVGFWYEDLKNSAAATKAFVMNRIGDFAFLLAMFILVREVGSLAFDDVFAGVEAMSQGTINAVVFLLFIGATGKSAQIPLFVWLPDAMAGPTPVSALIHAATMVTSGLYLLARMSSVVLMAPTMMGLIAVIGALTAIVAATIAIAQTDIKRVLAYSTVSQLGFMFMASGVGAFFVAIFHVVTHAFFKACLFLGSGSVIHGMHHVEHALEEEGSEDHLDPQDMRTMGGLKRFMPTTRWTYLVATLAIAGIPLTAGFFSKDEILFKAFEFGYDGHGYAWFVWGVGIVTALLTAVYMTRSYMLTFEGMPRWRKSDTVHPHESPWTITTPLVVLASLSLVGGFIGLPKLAKKIGLSNWIHDYLVGHGEHPGPVAEIPAEAHVSTGLEVGLILLGSLIAIVGVVWAWRFYRRHELDGDAVIRRRTGALYTWWKRSYYWDEFYRRTVEDPILRGATQRMSSMDSRVVDGLVNGLARTAQNVASRLRKVQSGVTQAYALAIVLGVALIIALIAL